jgi:hypothetical protein
VLAYELYLGNKGSTVNILSFSAEKPIKKIFVENGQITIDTKTLEQFGSNINERYKVLQDSLIMPLNTSDSSALNLPDFRTSPVQANPYVEIHGYFKPRSIIHLQIQKRAADKENVFEATFDISDDSIYINAERDIPLRIENKNYYFAYEEKEKEEVVSKRKTVYEKYVESGILSKNGAFFADVFTRIAKKFFEFIRRNTATNNNNFNTATSLPFSVYILPSNSTIEYVDSGHDAKTSKNKNNNNNKNNKNSPNFTDSFGNLVTSYGSKSTKNAKFVSFYEKAFAINCKKDKDFYRNLGIGKESLQYIFLDRHKIVNIAGFNWMFTDLNNTHYTLSQSRRGIFNQLYENFRSIGSRGQTERQKALLKVICFKQQQQKQEILIDENLTMEHMRKLFSWVVSPGSDIPSSAFEVLIYMDGKTALRDNYLHAVKSFIKEARIPKSHLLAIFKKIMRINISKWLRKDKVEIFDFFNRTDFCLKALSTRYDGASDMNASEEFAYKVGKMTRSYIDFKNEVEEQTNSLRDTLTYAKYDRDKLRFVMSTVCRGINLSNAKEEYIEGIKNKISKDIPEQEISDSDAALDYSYFFFKGYFDRRNAI